MKRVAPLVRQPLLNAGSVDMYLTSNIPYFKCWVRKEFTNGHQKYQGEFIHALAVAVTTIPDRSLSFQVIFTGCEADDGSQENVHGGAMWA